MTFPVDRIEAKLTEDTIQRKDGDAGPEEPDGEEDVEDGPPLLNFISPQVVPGDAGGQGSQGAEVDICYEISEECYVDTGLVGGWPVLEVISQPIGRETNQTVEEITNTQVNDQRHLYYIFISKSTAIAAVAALVEGAHGIHI